MAQHDMNIANQGFPAFRSDLNNALSAIQTTHSGTSRPTGAVAGQIWLDTTTATSPTLKYYDGTDDISLATIDHTANTVNWLDSTVSITGLSTTATGTVLTLSDTAHTTTVNLVLNNQTEIRFSELTANGSNYVGFKAPASLSADKIWTLPSADGTNGQALVTNGSGVLSFTTISAGTAWQSVQTTGFTAVSGRGYPCNTTSGAFTVTLPASASVGDYIQIVDYAGTFATNNLTVNPNGLKIQSGTQNRVFNTNRLALVFTYVDSTQGWLLSSGYLESTNPFYIAPYSVDFLVIAGGASGGTGADSGRAGGGGGAGGYRTSTQTVSAGTVITVTVGDGGTQVTTNNTGNDGSNSSISGSGLTTITSTGGGGGGSYVAPSDIAGRNGGSGGGGRNTAGTGNTPSTSPSQGNNGGAGIADGLGGGGGAGAVGGNPPSTREGGVGGNGTASSITGSSITRAGGGGGGGYNVAPSSGGTGGTGGGGNGGNGSPPTAGTNGTANTGGGGGGGGTSAGSGVGFGGAGGKGVVILSVPTASYSGTTTGSPTVTTSGSNTILQFNGSGSYTA